MELNWIIVGAVVILALILIIFLIKRNQKDEKSYEKFLGESDIPIEKDEDESNNY